MDTLPNSAHESVDMQVPLSPLLILQVFAAVEGLLEAGAVQHCNFMRSLSLSHKYTKFTYSDVIRVIWAVPRRRCLACGLAGLCRYASTTDAANFAYVWRGRWSLLGHCGTALYWVLLLCVFRKRDLGGLLTRIPVGSFGQ